MSIVAELQREALDEKVSASSLLRKALIVAHKLEHTDMVTWIELELNGYRNERTSIPAYRHLRGDAKVFNPYRGYQPLHFGGSGELADKVTKMQFNQPISEIEELARGRGSFACSFAPRAEATLMQAMELPLQPSLHFDKSQARGILDAVRNTILKWSLELEKKGVHGEGLSFSPQEKARAAPTNMTFNIGTMYQSQIQSDVQGSAIQTLTTNELDLDGVAKLIDQIEKQVVREASSSLLVELQADIASIKAQLASPKPKHPVIREGLRSVRAVLEQAGGNLAASGIMTALRTLIGP